MRIVHFAIRNFKGGLMPNSLWRCVYISVFQRSSLTEWHWKTLFDTPLVGVPKHETKTV